MDAPTLQQCYEAYLALRKQMSGWLSQSARMDGPGPRGGGEDESNYALAWFQHYLVSREGAVQKRFRELLEALDGWVQRECVHGYEPEAEAHHGTEPFLLFLPRYIDLFPEDEDALRLLLGAAQHIGNWSTDSPDWFDEKRGSFRSYHLGTRVVGDDPDFAYEFAEHIRFIHIALAAYRASGEQRYADWAVRYGRVWARRILASDPIPVLWTQDGEPVDADRLPPKTRRQAGGGHHVPNDPLSGIENLLASGAAAALGDLFRLNREEGFARAARRIAAPLVSELNDPFADPAAAVVSYIRETFGDRSLDGAVLEQTRRFPEAAPGPLAMVFPEQVRRRERGVGKRNDMIYWAEWRGDGSAQPLREPSSAAFALAYQMTGEPKYALRALQTAGRKMAMARRVLRGGREHADMGGAVCSVAAGHGRNWGVGSVTGCYGPLLLGTRDILSAVTPRIEFRAGRKPARPLSDDAGNGAETPQTEAAPGPIPSGVLPLVSDEQALFYNGSEQPAAFRWRPLGTGAWEEIVLQPAETARRSLP